VLAFWCWIAQNWGMQGKSDPVNRELMDAAALVGHLVRPGTVYALLAEHRRRLFPDEMFADLFASGRGRPSVPADVIATVMVLQALEGLSDRDAIEALRADLRWKVAAGLRLDDEGFHPTVLTLWRNKLRVSVQPQRILDAVRVLITESGVLAGRTRRVLDSTVLDDAVVRQDAIMQLVAQVRRVRRAVPKAARVVVRAHDYDSSAAKPACVWDDPADIERVVTELVNDAIEILLAVETVELDDVQADAVGLLALVAQQDVEPGDKPGSWRIARETRPDRIVSTVDPESRHVHKTNHNYRDGFKLHVAVEPDTGLITAVDLTAGNVGDAQAAPTLIADMPAGTEILGDSAYGSGAFRAHLHRRKHIAVIKPGPLQAAVAGGFTIDDFHLHGRRLTCPAGITVTITAKRAARFGIACRDCPLRPHCTTSARGRTITLHPQHRLLAAARRQATTSEFDDIYRQHRPMVERTLAWFVRHGHRKVRYRGIQRNRIAVSQRAAAINLQRLTTLGLTWNGSWTLNPR
jgi:IS5 family transposase